MTKEFDLLTVSTTTVNGYSDYVQIRADGTVIEITSNPALRAGDDVKTGRLSSENFMAIELALNAMLSPRSDAETKISCQAVIPDAPINQITMIKGNQRYEWMESSCSTTQKWHALSNAIRAASLIVLKPSP